MFRRAKNVILTTANQLVFIVRLQSKCGRKRFIKHGSIKSELKYSFHTRTIVQEYFFDMITGYLDKETFLI